MPDEGGGIDKVRCLDGQPEDVGVFLFCRAANKVVGARKGGGRCATGIDEGQMGERAEEEGTGGYYGGAPGTEWRWIRLHERQRRGTGVA